MYADELSKLIGIRRAILDRLAAHLRENGDQPDYEVNDKSVKHSTHRHTLVISLVLIDALVTKYAGGRAALPPEQLGFLAALADDPADKATLRAFADWIGERMAAGTA